MSNIPEDAARLFVSGASEDDIFRVILKWYTRGFDEGYKCRQKQEEEDDE